MAPRYCADPTCNRRGQKLWNCPHCDDFVCMYCSARHRESCARKRQLALFPDGEAAPRAPRPRRYTRIWPGRGRRD